MFAHMKIHKTAAGLHYGTTIDNWLHFAHTHTRAHNHTHCKAFQLMHIILTRRIVLTSPFFPTTLLSDIKHCNT